MLFPGFELHTLTVAGTRYRLRTGGRPGAPVVLLLHGQPETHVMWHAMAPHLAERFQIVCPDLPAHLVVAELAHDLLALMDRLGHERFAAVGHDFGAHVAARLALNAPERVERLAILEAVPLVDHSGRSDMAYALSGYRACWFAQLHPKPEALIVRAPEDWFRLAAPDDAPEIFHPEAVADYLLEGPWNEETRGHGAAADGPVPVLDIDMRGTGRRIACPILLLWARRGRIGGWYDPRQLWQACSEGPVTGGVVEAGHFMPEEAPEMVLARLEPFLSGA